MKPWKLFLDDCRDAPDGWVLARSVREAQELVLANGIPVSVSFDHDMDFVVPKDVRAGKIVLVKRVSGWFARGVALDPTGLDFADWFSQHTINGARLPDDFTYYIHTSNNRARPMIRDCMFRATQREPVAYHDWWLAAAVKA